MLVELQHSLVLGSEVEFPSAVGEAEGTTVVSSTLVLPKLLWPSLVESANVGRSRHNGGFAYP